MQKNTFNNNESSLADLVFLYFSWIFAHTSFYFRPETCLWWYNRIHGWFCLTFLFLMQKNTANWFCFQRKWGQEADRVEWLQFSSCVCFPLSSATSLIQRIGDSESCPSIVSRCNSINRENKLQFFLHPPKKELSLLMKLSKQRPIIWKRIIVEKFLHLTPWLILHFSRRFALSPLISLFSTRHSLMTNKKTSIRNRKATRTSYFFENHSTLKLSCLGREQVLY